jgi:uncharacterized protein YgiB involved in biofilm formation
MKKSKTVRLALLGTAGLTLAACDDHAPPSDAQFFSSVRECLPIHGEANCQAAATAAQQTAAAEAPRYSRKEECEKEFGAGNCETRTSGEGSGFFMPMLMGYMMGNMLGGGFNQPVYRGPDNTALTRSGGQTYNVGTFAGSGRNGTFQPGAATPVQRGGFGTSVASYRSTSSGG